MKIDIFGYFIKFEEKRIVKKISEKKSEYVISLKENKLKLHNEVKEFFESEEKIQEKYDIQKIKPQVKKTMAESNVENTNFVQKLIGLKKL